MNSPANSSGITPPISIPVERWEYFIRHLRDRISQPSESQPVTRCWKRALLEKAITEVVSREKPVLKGTFPPAKEIIAHLENLGWIRAIAVDLPKSTNARAFYLVDMEAAPADQPNAWELLQAWDPDGIICYLSAVIHHSLTSQRASHHHIARIVRKPMPITPSYEIKRLDERPSPQEQKSRASRNPLGSRIFSYQGIPFYVTRRLQSRLVGVQTRIEGPRTRLRITTIEQTLLDTFFHPQACGGLSVVVEAWENGCSKLDQSRLASYLNKINNLDLIRRTGAMLDMISEPIKAESLKILLAHTKEGLTTTNQSTIQMFPGIKSSDSNRNWGVETP
jgi:predicted transcriptional regulator of viral defense system